MLDPWVTSLLVRADSIREIMGSNSRRHAVIRRPPSSSPPRHCERLAPLQPRPVGYIQRGSCRNASHIPTATCATLSRRVMPGRSAKVSMKSWYGFGPTCQSRHNRRGAISAMTPSPIMRIAKASFSCLAGILLASCERQGTRSTCRSQSQTPCHRRCWGKNEDSVNGESVQQMNPRTSSSPPLDVLARIIHE